MPRSVRVFGSAFAAVAILLGGCDALSNEVICTAILVYGIRVTVQDSVSGAPVASGAQLIARDGAYADTASFPANQPNFDGLPLQAAPERPGTYIVTVRKTGFGDWVRNVTVVREDECHVRSVELTARLQHSP